MKNARVMILAMVLSSVAPALLSSQGKISLTLDECLRLALLHDPFLQAERAKEDQASYTIREAFSKFLPNLNAAATDVLDKKPLPLEIPALSGFSAQKLGLNVAPTYQFSLSFSVPLYAGGRLMSGYQQAHYGLMSARESTRRARLETVLNVKKAYYGYLLASKFASVAAEAVSLAEKHLENVKNLYGVQMASRFDLLRSEVQLANLKPQLIKARNGLKMAELGLKTLVGLDLDQDIEVKGELGIKAVEPDLNAILAQALAVRPEILEMQYGRMMASELIKMAKAEYLPVVSFGGAFNSWSDRFNLRKDNWDTFYSVNLVLIVPIFNGLSQAAKVGEAKAALKRLEYGEQGLLEMIKLEVREAVLGLEQARESLSSQEKNVEQAEETVRIAELSFSEGAATSLDVSSAHVALSQARTIHSQALYDYAIALAQLEKAVGTDPGVLGAVEKTGDGKTQESS
jgi:outer membrane protein